MANPGDDNSVQEIAPHVNGERSSRCKYELVHCLDGPFMFQMNTKNKWSSDINLSTDRLNRPSQQDPTATSQSTTTLRCSRKPADFPGVGITHRNTRPHTTTRVESYPTYPTLNRKHNNFLIFRNSHQPCSSSTVNNRVELPNYLYVIFFNFFVYFIFFLR